MGIFCFVLVGSIIGFLVYNTNPAKVFMGDTGSLTLGATMATIAILTSHELSLALVGGVFVIETLTVIIQITSVVLFKRKVFLMTPIHHHQLHKILLPLKLHDETFYIFDYNNL